MIFYEEFLSEGENGVLLCSRGTLGAESAQPCSAVLARRLVAFKEKTVKGRKERKKKKKSIAFMNTE